MLRYEICSCLIARISFTQSNMFLLKLFVFLETRFQEKLTTITHVWKVHKRFKLSRKPTFIHTNFNE